MSAAPAWAAKPPVSVASNIRGPRLVGLGDSITVGAAGAPPQFGGASWVTLASMLLYGQFVHFRNAGVSGNTSAQILARVASDVAPYSPDWVTVLAGANDVLNSVPAATTKTNIAAIVDAVQALGARAALATLTPLNSNPTGVQALNAWIVDYAATKRIPLIDLHSVVVNPATGNWKSGYSDDGTHPRRDAIVAMGQQAADTLVPYLQSWQPYLAASQVDPTNLIGANGLLLIDTNADGIPDGWTVTGGANGTTSLVADSASGGNALQLNRTVAAAASYFGEARFSTGFAVGDTIEVTGRVQADAKAGSLVYSVFVDGIGAEGNRWVLYQFDRVDIADGLFYVRDVVPAAVTQLAIRLITHSGVGKVRLAQPTIRNLSTLGVTL